MKLSKIFTLFPSLFFTPLFTSHNILASCTHQKDMLFHILKRVGIQFWLELETNLQARIVGGLLVLSSVLLQ
jgi:hypothetical protein